MNFQVSELARVLLLTYIASYAVRRADDLRSDFVGFLKPVGVLVVAAALLLLEPDFGAATVLFATGIAVLFLAGARIIHLLVPVVLGTLGLAALAVLSPYRLRRLTGFLDPWGDPFNSGFQLVQSLIAIGRGEWFGVGLGSSVQKLFYLPEAHTDFVFAVLAEEFGFAGVTVVIALFALLVGRALQISRNAAAAGQTFQSYVAAAIGIWLGLQAFVNIGVNMGLLPTKGLTLPLLSYGGSSMLITLGWLGVLLRIHHDTQVAGRAATSSSREPRRP
jgi:cell division protein FtsW